METKMIPYKNVHQGRNIRTTRLRKNMTQDALAELTNIPQSTLSKAENSKFVEEELLQNISTTLDVPLEYLKEGQQEASTVIFENNTIKAVNALSDTVTNVFDPVEKMAELYERLLASKDEKYADLEKRLQELENRK